MGWFSKKKKEEKVHIPYVPTPKYRVVENGLGEFLVQEYEFTGRGSRYVSIKRFDASKDALAFKTLMIEEDERARKSFQIVRILD